MATIITATYSSGTVRHCDAKCYNAKGTKCTCICGGLNHGVGHNQAILNSIEWLKKTALDYPGDNLHLNNNLQFHLFNDHDHLTKTTTHHDTQNR